MASRRRFSRGQIVIPALFVLPSLMLFLYLIFETAKLSREKIRMQFAVDTASFIDISNYADLLNRTAYVNGAFPSRVFLDAFQGSEYIIDMRDESSHIPLLQLLWMRGVFPQPGGYMSGMSGQQLNRMDDWPIYYAPQSDSNRWAHRGAGDMNQASAPENLGTLNVTGGWEGKYTWISYDRAVSIWQLVSQIFSLLGSVYEAQIKVNQRLMVGHSFYKKSWMLNTGLADSTADDGLKSLMNHPMLKLKCHYASGGGAVGFVIRQGPLGAEYKPYGFGDDPYDGADKGGKPYDYAASATSECPGLFQFATVMAGLDDLRSGSPPGYKISQSWIAPGNYFKVDVNRLGDTGGRPYVHVTTTVSGPKDTWPNPTPRFQTRQYP